MISLIKNRDYYGMGLAMLCFILVVCQSIISPAIVAFVILFLYELLIKKSLRFERSIYLIFWILLFVFYGLSIFKSEHTDIGLKLLEYKMSFFIFPIIFSFKKDNLTFWNVIQGFLFGVLVLLIGLTVLYLTAGQSYAVISSKYFDIHPTYSAAYITLGLFTFLYGVYLKAYKVHIAIVLALFAFSLFTLFALISFAGILFLLLSLLIVSIVLVKQKFGTIKTIAFSALSFLAVVLTVTQSERLSYDYTTAKQTIQQIFARPETFIARCQNATSGTKMRVLMWYFSYEVIKENPAGVGLGDIDFFLDDKVRKYNIKHLKDQPLNPHNQFLQMAIDMGVLGMLFFLTMCFAMIWFSIKHKNYLLLFIVFNLLFNCLFESMLQRQSGIVFYTLFTTMFIVYSSKRDLTLEK